MSMLVDSHAHLEMRHFAEDLPQVIERAEKNGLRYILTIGVDTKSSKRSIEIANHYQMVYAAIGIHPHDAKDHGLESIEELKKLAQHPRVLAIGEIGLDYYRLYSPKKEQQRIFRQQLCLAKELGLPIIIHNRDSHSDLLKIMDEEQGWDLGGVFHCFAGDMTFAQHCLDKGFYLSFAGNITYLKAHRLREVLSHIPLNRLLIETDCPYITPQAYRGKRNEPCFVIETARAAANCKSISEEELGEAVTNNFVSLFKPAEG
jgi:TatD DNase family protein